MPNLEVGNDTSAIERLIARARVRIRSQWALEGATTATILAAATALAVIFAMRVELVGMTTGVLLLIGSALIIVAGAVIGALRPLDDETVARRIDRASNLSDRLSTAIAFRRTMAGAPATADDDETTDLMIAAIRDGEKAVPRANIVAAAPFTTPKDLRAAGGFLAISALAAGLALPSIDRTPVLFRADPAYGTPGAEVTLVGEHLLTGVATPVAGLSLRNVIGAPNVPIVATAPAPAPAPARRFAPAFVAGSVDPCDPPANEPSKDAPAGEPVTGFVPDNASVYLGTPDKARPVMVLDWRHDSIRIQIPADAPVGDTYLTAHLGNKKIGPVKFTVVDPKDSRFHRPCAVQLDPDERAYVEGIIAELKRIAKREGNEELEKFAKTIEDLLEEVDQGKITKEQLLEAIQKAEDLLNQAMEPDPAELAKQMKELGEELEKNKTTKELGEALKKNDLEKAKEEFEKLAAKLDKQEQQEQKTEIEKQLADQLSEQEKQELAKKLEELQKKMEQAKTEQEKQELAKQQEELEKKLDKQLSEQEKKDLEKKLEELKKMADKPMSEQEKQQLQKQLEKTAKQMEQQQKQQQQKMEQQQQKLEEEIRRLQKQKDEAKTEQQRLDAERRLQAKKEQLKKLEKQEEQKNQSAQREAVKRLQKDIEKAAESLQKPKDKQESQEEQEERERQASRNMKDAARETGRVDQDQRKQATQKKMSSQMDDLREAMRRAKQKGNKGPKDPFGKNGKNKDFQARARGQKGNGQSWKPGQGQGQGQPGGQGQGQGGDKWGVGHDPNLTADSTDKSGNTKDEDLQGTQGGKGNSTRETILAAAQKGFAGKQYKKVYTDYQRIVEEVMRTEKLPSSYKYYVKRYFAKIHPSAATELDEPAPAKDNP